MKALVYNGPGAKTGKRIRSQTIKDSTDASAGHERHRYHWAGRHELQADSVSSLASHLDAAQFVTHRSRLDQMMEAYDVFERAADTDAIEVASNR